MDATVDFACLVSVLLAASARPPVVQLPSWLRNSEVKVKVI